MAPNIQPHLQGIHNQMDWQKGWCKQSRKWSRSARSQDPTLTQHSCTGVWHQLTRLCHLQRRYCLGDLYLNKPSQPSTNHIQGKPPGTKWGETEADGQPSAKSIRASPTLQWTNVSHPQPGQQNMVSRYCDQGAERTKIIQSLDTKQIDPQMQTQPPTRCASCGSITAQGPLWGQSIHNWPNSNKRTQAKCSNICSLAYLRKHRDTNTRPQRVRKQPGYLHDFVTK